MPPLRERGEDILLLANTFLEKFSNKYGIKVPGFSKPAEELLMGHKWPGNVRELYHAVERAMILAQDGLPIPPECLVIQTGSNSPFPIHLPVLPTQPQTKPTPTSTSESASGPEREVESSPASSSTATAVPSPEEVVPIKDMEREMILKALQQTNGNRTIAADKLGINARTLRNKIKQYLEEGYNVPSADG